MTAGEEGGDRLASWLATVEAAYPPDDAEDWDEVGLHVGAPDDEVTGVVVSLDVTETVIDEAVDQGANLVIAHHPLLFRPLGRLTPATAAGRLALYAARRGCAVIAAHTNVDVAVGGTSDPIVEIIGLERVRPLRPVARSPGFAPSGEAARGNAQSGESSPGHGPEPAGKGLGRVGELPDARTLADLARTVAARLPSPQLRLAGDPDRSVRRVAVCGGAGDGLIDAAIAAGAELYITADLRHHPTLDARTRGLALIDAGHYWTEAAALPAVQARLSAEASRNGLVARLIPSKVTTDPWTPADRWR